LEEDIKEFTAGIRGDMDNLIEAGPPIPDNIIRAFKRKNANCRLALPTVVNLGGLEVSHSRHSRHQVVEDVAKGAELEEKSQIQVLEVPVTKEPIPLSRGEDRKL